jgi:pilus assembly protein CpaE
VNAISRKEAPREAGSLAASEERLAAFVTDEATRAAIAKAIGVAWPNASITLGGIDEAIEQLARDTAPRFLVVDLAGLDKPLAALDRLAEVCAPGTYLVALGNINDVGFYRELCAAGVADYLVKPVTAEALAGALHAIKRRSAAPVPEKAAETNGELIAVVGARGGVGTTMVATSLAWLFAHEARQRTVLVDMDVHGGSAALALDVEPGRGLCEALENPSRIDSLFIASAAAELDKYLFLLSAEESLDSVVAPRPGALEVLTKELLRDFRHVVLDLPRSDSALLRLGLAEANTVILVTDFSLAGLRDVVRLATLSKAMAPAARVVAVGNRVGSAKKADLSRAEVEKALGMPLAVVIPEDAPAVPNAINKGKAVPEAAGRSKAAAALRQLAVAVGHDNGAGVRPGIVARLLGIGKAKAA